MKEKENLWMFFMMRWWGRKKSVKVGKVEEKSMQKRNRETVALVGVILIFCNGSEWQTISSWIKRMQQRCDPTEIC